METLLLNFFLTWICFTVCVGGCPSYHSGPKECNLWLKELGASTIDDKENDIYDERLKCAQNLMNACGANLEIPVVDDNMLKVILQYLSKTYYIYTDEEAAAQMLGYLGEDD